MATEITGTEEFDLLKGNDSFRSLSPFISGQFTARTREQTGNLVPFTEAYYEYLDEKFNVSNRLYNLLHIADVEFGAKDPDFRQLFREELSPFFPEDTKASYSIIFNRLINFYLSKGTLPAIRFLFRSVFDANVTVDYPRRRYATTREITFRYETLIRYSPAVVNEADLNNVFIETASGASAFMHYAENRGLSSANYFTSRVDSISGSFAPSQNIFLSGTMDQVGTLRSIVADYAITNAGSAYEEGEIIPLATSGNGNGFEARITKTIGSIGKIILDDQGDGYLLPPVVEIVGDGVGATATANILTGRVVSFTITSPGSGYTKAQIRIRTNPLQENPVLVFALASARVHGPILEIGFIDPGVNYTVAPTFDLEATTVGTGAVITLSVGAVSTRCIDRDPVRFNGNYGTAAADQNFLMFFHMNSPTYTFPIGSLVGQYLETRNVQQNSTLLKNLILDNRFTRTPVDTLPAGWTGTVLVRDASHSLFTGSPSSRFLTVTERISMGPSFTCVPGEVFNTSFYARTGAGQPYTFTMGVQWRNAAGTVLSTSVDQTAPTSTTSWTLFTATRTAPANAVFYDLYVFVNGPAATPLQEWAFALPTIYREIPVETDIVTFEGKVDSWDPVTQELVLSPSSEFSNLDFFDRSRGLRIVPLPVLPEDDVVSYLSKKYSRPFYIDGGDNEVNREFTYYIQSPLSISVFRQVLKDNTHPAGMNFISVVVDDSKEAEQFVGMFPDGADIPGTNSFRAFVEVDIMRDTRVVETRVSALDNLLLSTYEDQLIYRGMENGKFMPATYSDPVVLSPT